MIRDHTDTHQWDYIGTKDNPADYSSRGINVANDKAVQKCNGFKDHLFYGNQKQRSGLFKFNTFQIFLFCLYIRKFVNSLLNYPQKISLQNFKPLFPLILRIFDLECHGQTSLKVAFVKFAHVFMKFRKLESLHMENKKLHCHKTEAATGGVL